MNKSIVLISTIGTLFFLSFIISCQNQANVNNENELEVEAPKGFAEYMYYMQLYTHKLLLSVEHENLELADFYHHELEEVAEDVIEYIREYHDIPVGDLTTAMLMPVLDDFEDALDADEPNWDDIRHRARLIVRSCNACHNATGYAYIQMPEESGINPFLQNFTPTE